MTPVNPIDGPEYRLLALKIYAGLERGTFSPDEAACFLAISILASEHFEYLHPYLPKSPGIAFDDFRKLLRGI